MDCIFCQIISGQAQASFVYQDDQVVAFMSLEQPNPYKVLVVPRDHVETLFELNDQQAAAIFQATVKIARAIRAASDCDGLNLVQSNGEAGQQDVFHFHLHLLPRFWNDDIILNWNNTIRDRGALASLAGEIRACLRD